MIANLILWPYYFAGVLGWASLSLLLLVLWILGKCSFRIYCKLKERKQNMVPSIAEKQLSFIRSIHFPSIHLPKVSLQVDRMTLKALSVITTYLLLIGFLIGIFFYNIQLISEGSLKILALVTSLFVLGLSFYEIEKDEAVKTLMRHWLEGAVFQRIKSAVAYYWNSVNTLNIYCFPFVVITAVAISILFSQQVASLDSLHGILLFYLISMGFLLVSYQLSDEKFQFFLFRGKGGMFIKTCLYVLLPGYLIFHLTAFSGETPVINQVMALLLFLGSLSLIYSDRLYRSIDPLVPRKIVLKCGSIFLMIGLAYGGAFYTNQHRLKAVPVFADMAESDWFYPAMKHLYDKGILVPDADRFLHPGRILNSHEMLVIAFKYFDIWPDDFREQPDVPFIYISRSNDKYLVFKTAYYLGLIDVSFNINSPVSRKSALEMIGKLNHWSTDNYLEYAKNNAIIQNDDSVILDTPLNRALLAQMLYNLSLTL